MNSPNNLLRVKENSNADLNLDLSQEYRMRIEVGPTMHRIYDRRRQHLGKHERLWNKQSARE